MAGSQPTLDDPKRQCGARPGWVCGWGRLRLHWPIARFVVADASMEPALVAGDRLLVLQWLCPWSSLHARDIVVLHDPERPGHYLVKRVAVGPGDRWVAGAQAGLAHGRVPEAAWVPPGAYVVLGDNQTASRDSRHFGPVPESSIVGRVVWRYLPAERHGAP